MNSQDNIQKLVILGAGESGVGTALLAKAKGYDVFVSDYGVIADKYAQVLIDESIDFESEKHTETKILKADLVVKSPGIPDKVAIVQKLLNNEISVISEIEFAAKYTDATVVGITGSNGKTTTTMLTGHVLSSDKEGVSMAGNIGDSFAKTVLDNKTETFVLELSSFQLDGIVDFKPHIAVLTNLSPDHLDRYDYDYDKYVASKFRLVMNQTEEDFFIYDADDQKINEYLNNNHIKSQCFPFSLVKELKQGTYLKDNQIMMNMYEEQEVLMDQSSLSLKGKHNAKNAMAAATVAKLIGIRKKTIRESMSNFRGIMYNTLMIQKPLM